MKLVMIDNTLTDADLLALLKDGSEGAFDQIYNRYWKQLYNDAHKRLRNAYQSEEIIQDIFTNLWLKRDVLQVDNLSAYLFASVRNQVFMLYKKEQRLPFFEEPLDHMAAASLQADSLFYAKELKSCIDAWLETQPEKRREIFRLRYIEEFSTKEISDMLGISQKTVQNTLATALLNLKTSLGKYVLFVLFFGNIK